jgi:hypothetical protein
MVVISFSHEFENPADALVGDPVADLGFLPLAGDDSGQPENPEVLGNVRLRDAQALFGLRDTAAVPEQPVKKPDPSGVSQGPEGLRLSRKPIIRF